ncbi:MAG: hypothetical protein H0U45_13845 [Tatlockia sp.]|nr:hypothetical protein [Tatlockia sp.]
MFQELLGIVKVNISTTRSVIKTNERLRKIAFEAGVITKYKDEECENLFNALMQDIPKVTEWRVYDHCAVVTQLYAIYERFVEDLITDWLLILPGLVPCYSELEERIQNTHQIGVGRLLIDLNKNRYKHLSNQKVIRGLFYGVNGEDQYELLSDAFLFHEQNLRKDILEKLLADAGINNAWNWVDKHRAVKNFLEEIRGNQNTAEGELNELISYRNDAAHGAPIDNFLGFEARLELCDFVESLCQALAELVTFQVIERKKIVGQVKVIGELTEWFKKPKAGIAKVNDIYSLLIGDSLYLVSEGSSCCQLANIESIKIDNDSVDSVQTISGMEIGLKFDIDARKGVYLYILK